MALTVMTPEWTDMINDVNVYLIRERTKDENKMQNLAQNNPLYLFNMWVRARGVTIEDTKMAVWFVGYMRRIMNMPLDRLKLSADIDRLRY